MARAPNTARMYRTSVVRDGEREVGGHAIDEVERLVKRLWESDREALERILRKGEAPSRSGGSGPRRAVRADVRKAGIALLETGTTMYDAIELLSDDGDKAVETTKPRLTGIEMLLELGDAMASKERAARANKNMARS